VEMASAESDEDPAHVGGEAPCLTLPASLKTLYLNPPTFNPERKLEWNNDIPEISRLDSEHWRNHKTEKWMGHEEINHFDHDFSGNSMTEQALQPSPILQPMSRHQQELHQAGGPGGDVLEDQLYLPVHSDGTSVHQMINMSTVQPHRNSSTVEGTSNKVEENHSRGSLQSLEGSASSLLSSD
uniref:Uncharacterized protein n=2 Tax=Loxodonta africana TaxID=9785 RepID=G3TLN2_LOXAF